MIDNSNRAAMAQVEAQKDRLMRMMKRAHENSGRTGEELAAKWTKNICWYLYKRCREFSPTASAFSILGADSIALAQSFKIKELKNHLPVGGEKFSDKGKKRKDFTRVQDVLRARGAHRMYIASGWLNVKKIATKSGDRLQAGALRNGAVIVTVTGTIFKTVKVSILNLSTFARPFHDKHGIVAAALEDERVDLAQYISRKTKESVEDILRTT